MTSEFQDTEEQNVPNGRISRQPFTYSTELYDNLGHGEDTTKRRRSFDFESPPPNYSNNGSVEMTSPYNEYNQNGYHDPSYNGSTNYSHQQYDSSRGNLRGSNKQNQQQGQGTSRKTGTTRKTLPSDRLYQPRYLIERAEKRQAQKESEQIDYDTSFHASLPKNLQHVKSKFRDPNFIKRRQELGQEPPKTDARFKARIPKEYEYVTSRYQDPDYMKKSPRGSTEQEVNHEEITFRARPPRQLEHIGPRVLNEEFFKKKEVREEIPDRHQTEFHARLPENLQHVQSRILDPQYQNKQPPPDYHEYYDRTFKARLPKKLEHVQSKLLDPVLRDKSRAAENTDEQYYKPEFKARPPKNLEHVEKRIYDPKYFQPKPTPRSPVDEDEISHEFKSRPPRALASIESRIMDPRYFRKKSPVLAPIKPEDEYRPNFKARPPRDLEYIQSRVYDPRYFQKSERSSPIQSPKPERKGPVAIIKVKPEKKAELRPPGNSYSERLAMKKVAEEENYYDIWHKQFQEEVKRKIRADPETPKTVVAVVEEDKRVKKFGKKNQAPVKKVEELEERPVKSEGHDGGKPRMPWLKRKKKPPPIDKEYFDKWINIPEDVLKLKGDGSTNRNKRSGRSAPQVWANDFQQRRFDSPRRQEYVGYYGDYS